MSSPASQSLINLLLESGVSSTEEAAQLAVNLNGGSWASQVLDSGKVDEQLYLGPIRNFFPVPVTPIDAQTLVRAPSSDFPNPFASQPPNAPRRATEDH